MMCSFVVVPSSSIGMYVLYIIAVWQYLRRLIHFCSMTFSWCTDLFSFVLFQLGWFYVLLIFEWMNVLAHLLILCPFFFVSRCAKIPVLILISFKRASSISSELFVFAKSVQIYRHSANLRWFCFGTFFFLNTVCQCILKYNLMKFVVLKDSNNLLLDF